MKRRRAREYVLQFLYRVDFVNTPSLKREDLDEFWLDVGENDPDTRSFAEDIISGVVRNLQQLDSIIQRVAERWKISRIAAIDRNILRLGAYELLFRNDIPQAVTINEAIEIAKKYSTSESASFINGILDRIAKECSKK